jgi:chromosome segregation and condensation protein ScpB
MKQTSIEANKVESMFRDALSNYFDMNEDYYKNRATTLQNVLEGVFGYTKDDMKAIIEELRAISKSSLSKLLH